MAVRSRAALIFLELTGRREPFAPAGANVRGGAAPRE